MARKGNSNFLILLLWFGVILSISQPALGLDGSSQTIYNGHLCESSQSAKPVCANCHLPHGAQKKRLWARPSPVIEKSTPTKELCASCHCPKNPDFPLISSGLTKGANQWCGEGQTNKNNQNGNVFLPEGADHVMGKTYCSFDHLQGLKAEVPVGFPIDDEKDAKEGFYCGTCHNPHRQPQGRTDGHGDYLRVKDPTTSAGTTHDRRNFCRQCHPENGNRAKIHTGSDQNFQCESCHRPHDGYLYSPSDPRKEVESLIFWLPIQQDPFFSYPPTNYPSAQGKRFSSPSLQLTLNESVTTSATLPAALPADLLVLLSPTSTDYPSSSIILSTTTTTTTTTDTTEPDDLASLATPLAEILRKFSKTKRYRASSGDYYEFSECLDCHCYSDSPDTPKLFVNRPNHPLGRLWSQTSCAAAGCHQTGLPGGGARFCLDGYSEDGYPLPFNKQVFGCLACHAQHTNEILDNPSHLRYASFKNDDTSFCEHCHHSPQKHPKRGSLLQAKGGLHFQTQNNPSNPIERTFPAITSRSAKRVKCGGCMFCHYIHQREDDPRDTTLISSQRPDLKALMRVPPKTLNWGPQEYEYLSTPYQRTSPDRYEDICFGCHSDPAIVGESGNNGSLLKPEHFLSHRFACLPSSANTQANTTIIGGLGSGKFPLADGWPGAKGGVRNDYGTSQGQIFCGTCHSVHSNAKPPYLYQITMDDTASAFQADDPDTVDKVEGFCEQCHCSASNPDPLGSDGTHPTGAQAVPKAPITNDPFPAIFSSGGSGSKQGITTPNGGIVCLTCHNVHAASTSWFGGIPSEDSPPQTGKGSYGQLLIMDNNSQWPGSNLCRACHEPPPPLPPPSPYEEDYDQDGFSLADGDLNDFDPSINPRSWWTKAPAVYRGPTTLHFPLFTNYLTPADYQVTFRSSINSPLASHQISQLWPLASSLSSFYLPFMLLSGDADHGLAYDPAYLPIDPTVPWNYPIKAFFPYWL